MWVSRKEFEALKKRVEELEDNTSFEVYRELPYPTINWRAIPDEVLTCRQMFHYILLAIDKKITYKPGTAGVVRIE